MSPPMGELSEKQPHQDSTPLCAECMLETCKVASMALVTPPQMGEGLLLCLMTTRSSPDEPTMDGRGEAESRMNEVMEYIRGPRVI